MRWIIFLAIYVAFGLAFGVVLDQPIHSVASGYFWAWVLGWPAIIGAWILKWLLLGFVAVCVLLVAFIGLVAYHDPR